MAFALAILGATPAPGDGRDAGVDASAYKILVCMEKLLEARLGDRPDVAELMQKQAWIVVERSDLDPDQLDALHNEATALAGASNHLHDCIRGTLKTDDAKQQ